MIGHCHCGAVMVTVPHLPDYVNFCDCSLCAKSGGVWAYYDFDELTIEGETHSYRRPDFDEPAIDLHFCPQCATTTHWVTTEHFEGKRSGVNARIFEPDSLSGVEARFPDGRNWFGQGEPSYRQPVGKVGQGALL